MKRILILLALFFALFLIFATERVLAQELEEEEEQPQPRVAVTVKRSDVVNGVVVVSILREKKPFQLQCNEGQGNCKALNAGEYSMLELPKNRGMYDCKNVEIYRENKDKPEEPERQSEYCLIEP